jgi:hypothetical protein
MVARLPPFHNAAAATQYEPIPTSDGGIFDVVRPLLLPD